ncbi:flavin reductase family protein [Telmatobacter bradus]|uniref:flavin reductase family protein n=1 Tax=Telmatobacter bradus TaxID=474953 RepID=UPI003B43AC39
MNFNLAELPHSHAYKLMVGLIAPRPIALITTEDEEGRLNAAPFSAYNYLSTDPPIVAVGVANRSGEPKDTARNIRRTGEFVVNIVTEDLAEAMNICAIDFPPGVNELDEANLATAPSTLVKVPRIAKAHAALECREHTTLQIGSSNIVLGRIVAMYVEDRFVDPAGPYIKADELGPIGRMNGLGNYVRTRDAFFTIPRIPFEDWQKKK